MIGDANLYLTVVDEKRIAECGIMIAEEVHRGKGKGFETLILLLKYGRYCLPYTLPISK